MNLTGIDWLAFELGKALITGLVIIAVIVFVSCFVRGLREFLKEL